MFPLAQTSDAREGISGGVVVCEDGVLGLAESARGEAMTTARETYVLPLTIWADGWPLLANLIDPLVDANLRAAAIVKQVQDLEIGRDLIVEAYRPDVYLYRDADDQARNALGNSGGAIIIGRPESGKSRLAWELIREHPDSLVVLPRADRPPSTFETAGLADRNILLLFDDVHHVAETMRPREWQERVAAISGHQCPIVCTTRDGTDWARVLDAQGPLIDALGREALIFTSRTSDRGADLTREEGLLLADALGMSSEEFTRRFDGTPGSLAVDTEAMSRRYTLLRDRYVGTVAFSRMLDAAKILFDAYQPRFSRALLRAVSESILGNSPIEAETWRALERQTCDQGFGTFDSRGDFQTYRPYLESSVQYATTAADLRALLSVLVDRHDQIGAYFLGVSLSQRGDALAEAAFRAALPTVREANSALGVILAKQPGREMEAEEFYRVGIASDDGVAHLNYGNLLAKRPGRAREAEQLYREAIDRGVILAHKALGNLLRMQPGRERDAEDAYRAGSLAGDAEATFNLATYLTLQSGRETEAEQILRDAIRFGQSAAYRNLGILMRRVGRQREALSLFRDAVKNQDVGACNNLAELLFDRGFTRRALQVLQHAVALGDITAHNNLGVMLWKLNRGRDAVSKFRDAIAAGDPTAYRNLGLVLGERGFTRTAEHFFRRAISEGVESADASLGTLLMTQAGREDEAVQALRNGMNQGNGMAALNLGVLRGQQFFARQIGGLGVDLDLAQEAELAYRRALALNMNGALLPLGALLHSLPGRESEGCEYIRRAMEFGIQDAAETFERFCGSGAA